jgi:hypothetical protein
MRKDALLWSTAAATDKTTADFTPDGRSFWLGQPRVAYDKLAGDRLGERSAQIQERAEKARERQWQRFAGTALQGNGEIPQV